MTRAVAASMRISMPAIPLSSERLRSTSHSSKVASDRIADLLKTARGHCLVITGAGISVDSGIRAYRGAQGSYTVHKTYRPIFYHEFVESQASRQRYWARSYLGYPPVRVAEPNPSHFAVTALAHLSMITNVITQNVDRLHHKAHSVGHISPDRILELHGSLKHVVCLNCRTISDRDKFQDKLSELNPEWADYAQQVATKGEEPKSNPDGDVDLQNRSYDSFKLPDCEKCGHGPLKPNVVFFGENISDQVKASSNKLVQNADAVLVIGSSLATYSAYRLLKTASDLGKPVSLLSIGPSRGDPLISDDLRFDLPSTEVLLQTVNLIAEKSLASDKTLQKLLTSGTIKAVDTKGRYPSAS